MYICYCYIKVKERLLSKVMSSFSIILFWFRGHIAKRPPMMTRVLSVISGRVILFGVLTISGWLVGGVHVAISRVLFSSLLHDKRGLSTSGLSIALLSTRRECAIIFIMITFSCLERVVISPRQQINKGWLITAGKLVVNRRRKNENFLSRITVGFPAQLPYQAVNTCFCFVLLICWTQSIVDASFM